MQNQAIIPTSTKRSYKSAGTHWITTIPTDWRMQRVKSLLGERNERGHPSEPLLAATQSQGVVLKEKYDSRTVLPSNEVDQFKLVREGDFVISLRSFQGGIEYTYDQGIISPAYTVIYPYNPLTRDYFARLFKSRPFVQNLATCVTGIREGQNIDYTRLQVQTIPVPPPDEQNAIVRFLDHADEQIHRYIASKERLIALMEEERQAIIQQAVTRGLDPNVPLKDSGVEWLGDVPEHWEIRRAKYLYREADEHSETGTEQLMSVSHKTGVTPRKENVTMFLAESNIGHKLCRPGDIVINTMWAFMAALGVARQEGLVSPSYGVYRPHDESHLDHDYMDSLIRTEAYRMNYLVRSTGITSSRLRLYPESFLGIPLVYPPKVEQDAIAEHIDEVTTSVGDAITRTRSQIDLMNEYRTRLIADVVTGQLDVREAAAQLPAAP